MYCWRRWRVPAWVNRPWHLSFYGEGPMRDTLERLTNRLGLSNRVTFAGHRTVEEIWSANQVLVMPSRCEGLSLAMVEAMLCGRPILATDVGGNSEIILDGVTGLLAGAPSVPTLAQGLRDFGQIELISKRWARLAPGE